MAEDKPTLHHMNNSQSQRILWLIEELEIPYNLVLHERQKSGKEKNRSPPELFKTHPLGKAPQLVTAEGRVIAESSAIAMYLIERYDKAGKFKGDGDNNDKIRDEELSSLGGTSLNTMTMIELIFGILVARTPFFIRPLFSGAHSFLRSAFTGPEIKKMFQYLNEQIGEQDYFMGSNPGRADFLLSWPFDYCTVMGYVNLKEYPKVDAWYERIHQRDGWKRSLQKGNGYKLEENV